jgi:HSP20 family protein
MFYNITKVFTRVDNILNRSSKDFTKMFNDFDDLFDTRSNRSSCKEDEKSYTIKVELPGVKKEDIDISFEDDELIVKAKYNEDSLRDEELRFTKVIDDADQDNIKASLKEGILYITIAKKEQLKKESKKIVIE